MKRFTKSALCLLLGMFVTCMVVEPTQAQVNGFGLLSDPAGGQVIVDQSVVQSGGQGLARVPFGPRGRLYSQFGNGLGWEDGYTSASIFMPLHLNPGTDLIFLDVRGYATYNSLGEQSGGNVGLGYRRAFGGGNTIVGISAWGDADGGHRQNFFQAGASAEVIMNGLEMRVNGYLAEGDGTKNVVTDQIIPSPYFRGNNILVNRVTINDQQYDGFDAEIGGLILEALQTYGYVGGYYLDGEQFGDTGGVKVRWETVLSEDVQFGMQYSHDDEFGSSTVGNLMVQLPNTPWRTWWRKMFQPRTTPQHLARQVERNYRIPVKRHSQNTATLLFDPATGVPYFVHHVDPNATTASGQVGSVGNPFRTMQAAVQANHGGVHIIRVVAADNLTTPNGPLAVNGPIQLLANQRLLSSAVQHTLPSQFGSLPFPGFTGGPMPLLNNTSTTPGSVIQLVGNRTEVAGFTIDGRDINGAVQHAGVTNTFGIVDFGINQNTFQNAVSGIDLAQVSGVGSIRANTIVGMQSFGAQVVNIGGALNLAVEGNTINSNGGAGINVDQTSGSAILAIRDNNLDLNAGAGIGVALRDNAAGTFQITGNVVTRTVPDAIPLNGLTGEGINVQLAGSALLAPSTATLTNSIIADNIVQQSFSHGISVTAQENTLIQNLYITDNDSSNNGLNGLFFGRTDSAVVNNVQILRNVFNANAANGIELLAANAPNDISDFLIQRNQIVGNGLNGVELEVQADAQLHANMFLNNISQNAAHGILTTEIINAATDVRGISGTWSKNVISNNGLNGISSNASTRMLLVGLDGIDPADGQSRGNLITQNGLAGVLIGSSGSAVYTNNVITLNGALLGNVHEGAGVDIQGPGFKDLTFANNAIRSNFGDGLEFQNNNNGFGFPFTVLATGNSIESNLGRGVDILNQGDALSFLTFQNNMISSNNQEGFYVVNTSSLSQVQNVASTVALAADGATDQAPIIDMVLANNTISQNGAASPFVATGLVVRVGTSQFGFVSARVDDNTFTGNFGDDVYFESFTSTVAPAAAVPDPLAFVFMRFTGNTGDSLNVVNFGAFYNNADAGKSPNPPFTQGTARPRNAQREVAGFPGLGASTFVVEAMGGLDPANTLGNNFTFFDGFTSEVLLPGSGPFNTATTFTWSLTPVGSLFP